MRHRRVAIGLAVAAVVVIGLVDYATGPLLSMSAFYLVPTAWVTAVAGRRAGIALAALSGVSGIVSDVVLQPGYPHRTDVVWNLTVMFVTLVVVVGLVHRVRQQALVARDAEEHGREFLAFAAHQLRTPLAGIRSTVEALVVSNDVADSERLLGGLARESARAGRLVTALLRVARLDQHEPLPLRRADVAELARAEVDRAGVAWPMSIWDLDAPDGSVDILCNPDAVAEAIAALLDNARRHACSRVTVTVRAPANSVEIAISDDGPGLPPGQVDAAFQRFVSLDGRGGSGLGLPIARGIAEAHRGKLTYEDGTFTIRLPRLSVSDHDHRRTAPPRALDRRGTR